VEVIQLGFTSSPTTCGWPPSDAEDHAQGARPGVGICRATAFENQATQDWQRKWANKALKIVVQPVTDSRVGTIQSVDATTEKPLSADQAVQLAIVVVTTVFLPAQYF